MLAPRVLTQHHKLHALGDTRNHPRLRSGYAFHIYNCGNNKENIFREERNYAYFLEKYVRFIKPISNTYAYCLMPNHFHFMVQFKSYEALHEALPDNFPLPHLNASTAREIETVLELDYDEQISLQLSNQFRKFFSSYARGFNLTYKRSGKLLEVPFRRIEVDQEDYFQYLIAYIHRNPIHHRFCQDYTSWRHSSYREILRNLEINSQDHYVNTNSIHTILDLPFLQEWFGDSDNFQEIHQEALDWLENKWLLESSEGFWT